MSLAIFRPHLSSEGRSRKTLWWLFACVLVLHALMTAAFSGRLKWLKPQALPEIIVELGAAPPVAASSVAGDGGGPSGGAVEQPVRKPREPHNNNPKKPLVARKDESPKVVASTVKAEVDAPRVQPAPSEAPTTAPVLKSATGAGSGVGASAGAAFSSAGATDAVKTVEADYKPAYLNNPRPPYPKTAFRLGIEGTVVVWAEVAEDGIPMQIKLYKSSGNDLLDESALSTVAKWKFSPARKEGRIIRSAVKIPITFSLRAPY
jgi:protein TonB